MKQFILLLMMLVSFNSIASGQQDYEWCVDEVEMQHSDDKEISVKDYNDMIKECAFEAEVEVKAVDLKTKEFIKAHKPHGKGAFKASCEKAIDSKWKHLCKRSWFYKCVKTDKNSIKFCVNNH